MRRTLLAGACLAGAIGLPSSAETALQPPVPARPLQTALVDPWAFGGDEAPLAFRRTRALGAGKVRLTVSWSAVAPPGPERPSGFDAADPADPAYRWDGIDRQVRLAVANGLDPILSISAAPAWANEAPRQRYPRPAEIGAFAQAAATRYSGRFGELPRVRHWQVWNEPNHTLFLAPQFEAGRPASPARYRGMVNAVAQAVRRVHADNIVIAGGLSPFGSNETVAPLRFMRELLCMSAGRRPTPTCRTRVDFDVWSHHPYTVGGPHHSAYGSDNVSLGDLPEMRDLLLAAVRAGHARPRRAIDFWVTEFSWDTSPPDPHAVPARLHARWVAEALHTMWRSGVTLVTWFQLRDQPYPDSWFQSGLYYHGATPLARARPKPALQAFRFPFVAHVRRNGVHVWGRVPTARAARVTIERRDGSSWRRIAVVASNRHGVFERTLRTGSRGHLRARTGSRAAVPFALRPPPDVKIRSPFG